MDMPGRGDPVELLATEVGQPILAFISALFTAALVGPRINLFLNYQVYKKIYHSKRSYADNNSTKKAWSKARLR